MNFEEVKAKAIKVYSACPGWCKSDMGGWEAPSRTSEMGADDIVYTIGISQEVDPKFQGKHFRLKSLLESF
jgi:hypothetical protein